jgi:hypothetical protein
MDKIKEAANIITQINKYRDGSVRDFELINSICSYFDNIKQKELSISDLKFMKYISNVVGIPHYYDLLSKFNQKIDKINNFDLNTFSSIFYESTLCRDTNIKIHKYQEKILDSFKIGKQNRFFLSASTSFGKTFIAYEIIKKMKYNNVVLIFPTIALLSENLDKLVSNEDYIYFKETYRIHTLSEVYELGDKNLFIYTPERFLSFIEKNKYSICFDIVFVDEAYKMDNEYIIDEKTKENERDVAYRIAVYYSLIGKTDILLAGPYIESPNSDNNSFNKFLTINNIKLINYNNIEIVNKNYYEVKSGKKLKIDESFIIEFHNKQKIQRLLTILTELKKKKENTIIYCFSKYYTEKYANEIINSNVNNNWDTSEFKDFIQHIKKNFHNEWILLKALEKGIGIHHGLIPKYIQKEIILLFNSGLLSILLSTTTITEGVNTSAKNLIVLHNKKGNKDLKNFDAKNISGRAGRFLYHFSGRVIVLQNEFMNTINSISQVIKHKNYDINSQKDEIDLFYTDKQFLNKNDKVKKRNIEYKQKIRNIPDNVIKRFKVISRKDKLDIYDIIKNLSQIERIKIRKFISRINLSFSLEFDGLQVILNSIEPIVKNEKLKFLIEYKKISDTDSNEYSIFVYLLHYYLRDGFVGSMKYKIEKQDKKVDKAIRETAEFIYNILKYQVVKYLGAFNLMYKFIKSQEEQKDIDEVVGIDKLLLKLEYNALTEKGRLASDYGVPHSVLEYYENHGSTSASEIKNNFDNYENRIFNKIEKIISNK